MLKPDIAFSLICQTLGNSGKQCVIWGEEVHKIWEEPGY